ncbi:hypothetical protein [Streptomyces sp. CBMA123]|uniref:hypothetical protein n=1 Tax=Streptomyces sp. CBMA123 TaxID=1896313 RepID=UPI001661BE3D|nr:hypothetical protein [Streptomyces sp. CBMA123]
MTDLRLAAEENPAVAEMLAAIPAGATRIEDLVQRGHQLPLGRGGQHQRTQVLLGVGLLALRALQPVRVSLLGQLQHRTLPATIRRWYALAGMLDAGWDPWRAEGMVELYGLYAAGHAFAVSPDVEKLSGWRFGGAHRCTALHG